MSNQTPASGRQSCHVDRQDAMTASPGYLSAALARLITGSWVRIQPAMRATDTAGTDNPFVVEGE